MRTKPIYVTEPALAPLEELIPYLQKIWDRKVLTNGGPFHQELEQALCAYLGVEYLSLFNNGTIALMTAVQSLELTGEVITTPYSFVATTHSLLWNALEPVFVDIDPGSLNLDSSLIEAAITPRTSAILPVHCYGYPCDVEGIREIADAHNLKVIYDAAHAFGARDQGGSLVRHGDLSVLSFHATKVFNTFEGGAIISPDAKTKARIDQLKNFGMEDPYTINHLGLNGKMSEFNAAFGLVQVKYVDAAIAARAEVDGAYRRLLRDVDGICCLHADPILSPNHAYFPILVEDGYPGGRDGLWRELTTNNIMARQYFYPLISNFKCYQGLPSASAGRLPVATEVARKVLCLPIFPSLSLEDIHEIVGIISRQGRS